MICLVALAAPLLRGKAFAHELPALEPDRGYVAESRTARLADLVLDLRESRIYVRELRNAATERNRQRALERVGLPTETAVALTPTAPPPTAAPKATPVKPPAYEGDIPDLIHSAFEQEGLGEHAEFAVAVAWCESRFDPLAISGGGALGLFQLHPRGLLPRFYEYGFDSPFDPWQQAVFVAKFLQTGSWSHWTCA